jgi:hypothetical protein
MRTCSVGSGAGAGVECKDAPGARLVFYSPASGGASPPIVPAQVEYEFIVGDGRTIRFHLGCAGLWEAERRRRAYLTSF